MTAHSDKPMSLIERKKQQWAKEREELAGLCTPWGSMSNNFEEQFSRKRYTAEFSGINNATYPRKNSDTTPRRSSLPPLYRNQYNSIDKYERDKDIGGETSGYGSDNPVAPDYSKTVNSYQQSGYESSSSYKEDRPKWGDRGLVVSKFWGSRENVNYAKIANEPPGWVKRGLEGDREIVVANSSPAESPQQDYGDPDRPYTSSSNLQCRSYVRGRNVPVDHIELLERERRRQVALAHQEAIRKQLEEREQRRREEKERKIREEHEEELRIEREQEIERQRREHEQKLMQEKQEREMKRKEAIKEAMELAEKQAKLEKMKQKISKQNNINLTECIVEKDRIPSPIHECKKTVPDKNQNIQETTEKVQNKNFVKLNNVDHQNNNLLSNKVDTEDNNETGASCQKDSSSRENSKSNNKKNVDNDDSPKQKSADNLNTNIINVKTNESNNNINCNVINSNPIVQTPLATPRIENVALLLQSNLDSLQNMQYAVLVPTINPTTHTAIPIAVPIPITTERDLHTARTENRLLTPTQYRNEKTFCDSSTQTDNIDFGRLDANENKERFIRDKINSVDLGYENRNRKERRSSRNEGHSSHSRQERPKWGANRPPTRYLKQSEKDPLYQRRKMRQKMRETKTYEDKNSSDESQTASPRSFRKQTYIEKRHCRALWRKSDQIFSRNIRMYQTEIIPLEADKDQIYYKQMCERQCCCHCRCSNRNPDNAKVDILKIENNSPREGLQRPDLLPSFNNDIAADMCETSEQFSSLTNEIAPRQEHWENSPRTPTLSASTRYNDNL